MLVEIGTGAALGRVSSRLASRRELEQREWVAAGRAVQPLDGVVSEHLRPTSSSAASGRSSPAMRSVRMSAPFSSEGWPSRTARTSAIGSARSRRAANSSVSALERSSQCASSMSSASGPSSAHAESRLSVAAPTAKRSRGRAGPSASAPASAVACGAGISSSAPSTGRSSSASPANGITRLGLDPRGLAGSASRRRARLRVRAARSSRSPARRQARARRYGPRAPAQTADRALAARRGGQAISADSDGFAPPVPPDSRRDD